MTVRLAILMIFLTSSATMAQDSLTVIPGDTLIADSPDTVLLKSYAARYDPRKALMYAAVLPGLGQIYNKKYWKLPLVYGGFVAIGYYINFWQDNYIEYKGQLFYNLDHGIGENESNGPMQYTTAALRTIVDKSRRNRDFWVIMIGAMYILQIVDAHVDAHLKEFDLNPTLKVSVRPSVSQDELLGQQNSLSVVLKF
jgi:hypothetical protein